MLTDPQRIAFHTELLNDPKGLGYAVPYSIGNDDGLAALVNVVHDGGDFQVNNEPRTKAQIMAAVSTADWDAMTPENVQKFVAFISTLDTIPVADDSIFEKLVLPLPAEGDSRTTLAGLRKRQGTRGEVVSGINGFRLTGSDVAYAKSYTP